MKNMRCSVLVVLALIMSLLLCSCESVGNKPNEDGDNAPEATVDPKEEKSKIAYDTSKEAYNHIIQAIEIVKKMDSDEYEVWRLAIYEKSEIKTDGSEFIADKISLTEQEFCDGFLYYFKTLMGEKDDYENAKKQFSKSQIRSLVAAYAAEKDPPLSLFTMCVQAVVCAYDLNGKAQEAKEHLDAAKTLMKSLSKDYSDYEHYPALKGLYTTASSYYDFCVNPTGSFEQLKSTLEDYRNKVREYKSNLDFIFEEDDLT